MTRTRTRGPQPRHRAPRRRHRAAWAAIATTLIAGTGLGGTAASGAWFTDTAAIPNHSFASGNVDLTAAPATAAYTVSGMSPGALGYGTITITNPGSLTYRYSATQSSSGTLGAANLLYSVRLVPSAVCDATSFGAGTVLRSQVDYTTTTVFGSSATGAQAGDRTLAPGGTEYLCIRIYLPPDSPNTTQGTSLTTTFTFDAEQTKNN